MPMLFIPWEEFLPDLGKIRNSGLVQGSEGQIDVHGHWSPAPRLQVLDGSQISSSGAVATGLFAWPFGPTDYRVYVGTDEPKLYEYDAVGAAVNDVSRTVGGAYTGTEWFFTGFGGHVMAVNGVDADQILLSTASAFQDCYTSTLKPRGKYVSSLKSHIVIGNYTVPAGDTVPHGVWISATDDARQMLSGSLNSDFQALNDDLGHVMGLNRGRDYLLIARERGWTRLDGPPYSFVNIETSDGLYYSRSIVDLGNDTFYLSNGSVKAIRSGTQVVDIGRGKVARMISDLNFSEHPFSAVSEDVSGRLGPSGTADPSSSMVLWQWASQRIAGVTQSMVLAYNTHTDRFSIFRLVFSSTISNASWVPSALGTRGVSSLFSEWSPLRPVVLAASGITGSNNLNLFEFSPDLGSACVFQNGFQSHAQEQKQRYTRLRPVFRMKEGVAVPSISLQITTTDYPWGAITSTDTLTTPDKDGWFYPTAAHIAGHFLSLAFTFGEFSSGGGTPLGVSEFEGWEAEFEGRGL